MAFLGGWGVSGNAVHLSRETLLTVGESSVDLSCGVSVMPTLAKGCSMSLSVVYEVFVSMTWSMRRRGSLSLKEFSSLLMVESHDSTSFFGARRQHGERQNQILEGESASGPVALLS